MIFLSEWDVCIVSVNAADVLAMSSAARVLSYFSSNIPVPATDGLDFY